MLPTESLYSLITSWLRSDLLGCTYLFCYVESCDT
jgi:hypothetical protein